jgi:hypothetical protein
MSHHADKKHKKLAQLLKNRKTQQIQAAEDMLSRERDLDKEREEDEKKARAGRSSLAARKADAEPAWSARMQQIRDKNTGRHTMAKERWNRFAGTESGGGRGL